MFYILALGIGLAAGGVLAGARILGERAVKQVI